MLCCIKILQLFETLSIIATIICISFVCHLSSKDPFENHTIQDLSTYFSDVPNITNLTTKIENENKSNDEKFGKFVQEEQIMEKIQNISSESTINEKKFLRRLVSTSFCSKTRNKFQKYEGRKLSKVFELNMKKIHKLSIGLIVVICFPIVIGIVLMIVGKTGDFSGLSYVIACSFCLVIGALITNLVLLIIIAVVYNKGDIGDYKDFLDCPNVKKKFFDNFSDVVKLRKYFIAFEVLDAIFEVLGTLVQIGEAFEQKDKIMETNSFGY